MVMTLQINEKHVLLLDIDGVLLEPVGYRKAVFDTVGHFFQEKGIASVDILEEEIAAFEAQGITSEWDIIPLYILTWLEANSQKQSNQRNATNWQDLIEIQGIHHKKHVSNLELILHSHKFLMRGSSPTQSFLNVFANQSLSSKYFPKLSAQKWVQRALLNGNAGSSSLELLREYQNKIQTKEIFEKDGEWQEYPGDDSYLLIHDQPLIDPDKINFLRELVGSDNIALSTMTARPSYILEKERDQHSIVFNYPEAEISLRKTGLNFLPLAGFGQIQLLSTSSQLKVEEIIKPAFYHAFLAFCQALSIPLSLTIKFISDQTKFGNTYLNLHEFEEPCFQKWINHSQIHFHVFEDSSVGVQAVRRMQASFFSNGIHAFVHAYGIARNGQKILALQNENACIYPSINQALSAFNENLC